MENDEDEEFHFDQKNYFLRFKQIDNQQENFIVTKHIRHALEYFLADIKHDRNKTIERFLSEQTVNEIFLSLAQLVSSPDERLVNHFDFFFLTKTNSF